MSIVTSIVKRILGYEKTKLGYALVMVGMLSFVIWVVGILIVFLLGIFSEFYSIYVMIPFLTGYSSIYFSFKMREKINNISQSIKSAMSAFKVSEGEARDYIMRKIENEVFRGWLGFNILLFVVVFLLVFILLL